MAKAKSVARTAMAPVNRRSVCESVPMGDEAAWAEDDVTALTLLMTFRRGDWVVSAADVGVEEFVAVTVWVLLGVVEMVEAVCPVTVIVK